MYDPEHLRMSALERDAETVRTRVLVDVISYGGLKGTRVRLPDGSTRWVSPDDPSWDEGYDPDGALRFYLWI